MRTQLQVRLYLEAQRPVYVKLSNGSSLPAAIVALIDTETEGDLTRVGERIADWLAEADVEGETSLKSLTQLTKGTSVQVVETYRPNYPYPSVYFVPKDTDLKGHIVLMTFPPNID